jgi:hypothetical protein
MEVSQLVDISHSAQLYLRVILLFGRFTTKNLAEKIKGLQAGQTVDISGLMNLDERKSQ